MKTSIVSQCRAGAFLGALLVMVVMSLLALETVRVVQSKYVNASQAARWQESLFAAESGVDLALVELRKATTHPQTSWQAPWTTTSGTRTGAVSLAGTGAAGAGLTVAISVEAPAALIDSYGLQYYRIRSTGTALLPGPMRFNDERAMSICAR